jgi:hypothetical protein
MGQIHRLTRGRVKPYNSVPRIDWSHPLAAGLATYCYDVGNSIVDLVRGDQIKIGANGTAPFGSHESQFGRGRLFPLDGWGSMPPFPIFEINPFGGAAPYSAAMGTLFTGAVGTPQTSPDSVLVSVQAANNNLDTFFAFNVWQNGAPGNPHAYDIVSAVFGNASNGIYTQAVSPGNFQTWGCVATSGSSADLYGNGVFDNTFAGTTTFSGDSQAQIMYATASINAGQTFGTSFQGFVPYYAMWSRALSAAEMMLLHQDPYCFLIYPEDEMFSTLVGAAAPLAPSQSWGFFDRGPPPATATNQFFGGFQPEGTITPAFTRHGWTKFFDSFAVPPVPSARQKFDSFEPAGRVFNAAPSGWSTFFDVEWIPPFPASLQRHEEFQPKGAIFNPAPSGWPAFFDVAKLPQISVTLQRFDQFQPAGTIQNPSPAGWVTFFDKGPAPSTAANLPFDAALKPPIPLNQINLTWFPFFDSGPPPSTAARQPFNAHQPQGALYNTPLAWGDRSFFDSAPIRLTVNGEPVMPWAPGPSPTLGMAQGFYQSSWIPQTPPHFRVDAFTPLGSISPAIVPRGWSAYFDNGNPPPPGTQRYEFLPQGVLSTRGRRLQLRRFSCSMLIIRRAP